MFNPYHGWQGTTEQIFGYGDNTSDPAPMTGFIKNYNSKINGSLIMECLNPPVMTPAMAELAEQFAVFDRYFSSVPGISLFLFFCVLAFCFHLANMHLLETYFTFPF